MKIILEFENKLNHSLQVGDTIWYATTGHTGGYETADSSEVKKLGRVEELSNQYRAHTITVSNYILTDSPALANAFIMFSKNNNANASSLVGYYAKARFENNSKEKAELFAVGSEINESSK